MKNRNIIHSDNWETPEYIYKPLNDEFKFNFDPCPINNAGINEKNDGLLIEWGSRCFINPPYSRRLKEEFIKKAIHESSKGKLCVCLIPVSTSTVLFHDYILPNITDEIRFLKKRVKFIGINTFGEKVENKCGMHDSMIVIFDRS